MKKNQFTKPSIIIVSTCFLIWCIYDEFYNNRVKNDNNNMKTVSTTST